MKAFSKKVSMTAEKKIEKPWRCPVCRGVLTSERMCGRCEGKYDYR